MKKLRNLLTRVALGLGCSLAIGGLFASLVRPTASSTSRVAVAEESSDEIYRLTYDDESITFLLNGNLKSFKSISKSTFSNLLSDVSDALVSVLSADATDLVDVKAESKTKSELAPKKAYVSGSVDTETIAKVVIAYVSEPGTCSSGYSGATGYMEPVFSKVQSALEALSNDGDFATLIEYYTSRTIESRGLESSIDIAALKSDVTTAVYEAFQEQVNHVYYDAGLQSETPDTLELVKTIVEETAAPDMSLDGMTTTFNIMADAVDTYVGDPNDADDVLTVDKIVAAVGRTTVKEEIADLIANEDSDELVDFLIQTDSDTLIAVVKACNLTEYELQSGVENIGIKNFVKIIEEVGYDNVRDLFDACQFDKSSFKDYVSDGLSGLSFKELFDLISGIKIDGHQIYEDGKFKLDALMDVITDLPRPKDIRSFSDDEMQITWDVVLEIPIAKSDFQVTIGFFGNCDLIRTVAGIIDDCIDINKVDGVLDINVRAPEKLAKGIAKILNSENISDDLKHEIFDFCCMSVDEMYQYIVGNDLDYYIDLLVDPDMNYTGLMETLLSAQKLNDLFNVSKFSDERIDRVINAFMSLVGRASEYTYDDIKAFVNDFIELDVLDNEQLEKIYNKFQSFLIQIDGKNIDADLLRKFIDPDDDEYNNEKIYSYIEGFRSYTSIYNKVIDIIKKIYDKVPEKIKDKSIMDYYVAEGEFAFAGTKNFVLSDVIDGIFPDSLANKLNNGIAAFLDRVPTTVSLDLDVQLKGFYSITYVFADSEKVGLLPAGTDATFFANAEEDPDNGRSIVYWVDAEGNEITKMPAADTVIYPVYDFEVTTSDDISKEYDADASTISVTCEPEDDYTYQWYKDDVAINGATSENLDVTLVADSGTYYCEVTSSQDYTKKSDEITVEINPATVEIPVSPDDVTYTASALTAGFDADDRYTMSGDTTATNVGTYTVTFTLADTDNYIWADETTDVKEVSWTIVPQKVTAPALDSTDYTFNNTEVGPGSLDCTDKPYATTASSVFTATDVGTYTITVSLSDKVNYTWDDDTTDDINLEWNINANTINLDDYHWVDENGTTITDGSSLYTYDGGEQKVLLVDNDGKALPSWAEAAVTITGDAYTNAGEYTAKAKATENYANVTVTGSVDDLDWNILKATITAPIFSLDDDSTISDVDYDGQEHTVTFDVDGDEDKVDIIDGSIVSATNAGEYSVTLTLKDADNYEWEDGATLTFDWTINVIEVELPTFKDGDEEVTDGYTFTYDANEHTIVVTVNDKYATVDVTSELTATNADTYTITVKLNDTNNFKWSDDTTEDITFTWTIEKITITDPIITIDEEETDAIVYDGESHDAAAKFATGEEAYALLVEASGNTNETNAGEYTLTLTLNSTAYINYQFSNETDVFELVWSINQYELDLSKYHWVDDSGADYDENVGFEYKWLTDQTLTVRDADGNELPEFIDASYIHYTDNVKQDAGEYTASLTVDATDNWTVTGTCSIDWKITPKEIAVPTFSFDDEDISNQSGEFKVVYDGEEKAIVVTVDGVSEGYVTVTGNNATTAGVYTITVHLVYQDNWLWDDDTIVDKTFEWEITRKTITSPTWVEDDDPTFEYDNEEHTVDGLFDYDDENIELVTANIDLTKTDVGEYAVIFQLKDTLNTQWDTTTTPASPDIANKTLSWTITKVTFDLSDNDTFFWAYGDPATAYVSTEPFTYDATEKTVFVSGLPTWADAGYIDNAKTDAGNYVAKVTSFGNDNYEIINYDQLGDLSWRIKPLEIEVPSIESLVYNGEEQDAVIDYDDEHCEIVTLESTTSATDVNTYVVVFKISDDCFGNYVWEDNLLTTQTVSVEWTIEAALIDAGSYKWQYSTDGGLTWTDLTVGFEYDDVNPLTYEIRYDIPTWLTNVDESGIWTASEPGSYSATIGLMNDPNGNYVIEDGTSPVSQAWTISYLVDVPTVQPLDDTLVFDPDTYTFEYTGSQINVELVFDEFAPEQVEVVGDSVFSAVAPGTYHIYVQLNDTNAWSFRDVDPAHNKDIQQISWTIAKQTIDFTTDIEAYLDGNLLDLANIEGIIYDGDIHEITFSGFDSDLLFVDVDSELEGIDADSYTVRIYIRHPESYAWKDAQWADSEYIEFTWTIEQRVVSIPTFLVDDVEYIDAFIYEEGVTHVVSALLDYEDLAYVDVFGEVEASDAGTYYVVASLIDDNADNIVFADYTNDSILFIWEIEKAEIDLASFVLTIDEEEYDELLAYSVIYDGDLHLFDVDNFDDELVYIDIDNSDFLASEVGEYQVTFYLVDEDNYVFTYYGFEFVTYTFTWEIEAAEFDISAYDWDYDDGFVYDGEEHFVTLEDLPEWVDIGYIENSGTNADIYVAYAVVLPNDNYVIVGDDYAELLWYISPSEIANPYLLEGEDYEIEYCGEEITVTIEGFDEELMTYSLFSVDSATEVGYYSVIIELNDNVNYVFENGDSSIYLTWSITTIKIDALDIYITIDGEIVDENTIVYDGNAHVVAVEGEGFDEDLMVWNHSDVGYSNVNTDAGVYLVEIDLLDTAHYEFENSIFSNALLFAWYITPAEVNLDDLAWDYTEAYTYNADLQFVALANAPEFLDIVYFNNIYEDAGDYTASVIVLPSTNYVLTGSIEDLDWTINQKVLSVPVLNDVEDDAIYTYDPEVSYTAMVSVEDDSLVFITGYNGVEVANVGDYYICVLINDVNNYVFADDSVMAMFTWSIAPVVVEAPTLSNDIFTYDGTVKSITTSTSDLYVVTDSELSATDAGIYFVNFLLKDSVNYVWADLEEENEIYTLAWCVAQADVDLSTYAWDYTEAFTYDGELKAVSLVDVPDYVEIIYCNIACDVAGDYVGTALVMANDNLNIICGISEIAWSINKASIDMSDVAWNYTEAYTYNTNAYTVELNNVPELVDAYYIDSVETVAGDYTAYVELAYDFNNYELINFTAGYSVDWTINKAEISLASLSFTTKEYDGENHDVKVVYAKNAYKALVSIDTDESTLSATNVGTYTVAIIINDYNNYKWADAANVDDAILTLTWSIAQAEIDLTSFEWDYDLAFTYDGFAHSVAIDANSVPSYFDVNNINYKKASYTDAGTYEATAKVAASKNYKVTGSIPTCTWTINKAIVEGPAFLLDNQNINSVQKDGEIHEVKVNVDLAKAKVTGDLFAKELGNYNVKVTLINANNYEWATDAITEFNWTIVKNETKMAANGAFTVSTNDDGSYTVTVTDVNGELYARYVLNNKEVDPDNIIDSVKEALNKAAKEAGYASAEVLGGQDIYFTDEGEDVSVSNGKYSVKMYIPEEYRDYNLTVYYLADNGDIEEMEVTGIEGNYITFNTTHFSTYILVKLNEKTSVTFPWWIIPVIIALIAVPCIIVLLLRKKDALDQVVTVSNDTVVASGANDKKVREIVVYNDGSKKVVNRSYRSRLIQSNDAVKEYYKNFKREILAYCTEDGTGITDTFKWDYESFYFNNKEVARVKFNGKNIVICLPVNKDDYVEKMNAVDSNNIDIVKGKVDTYTIKNDNKNAYVNSLLTFLTGLGLAKEKEVNKADLEVEPYQDDNALIAKGLIKLEDAE